jgi:hypothetical protein
MIEPRKDKYETDYEKVAERFSLRSELRDPGFWKEYFYWSWRCLLFVLFIVIATNYDYREGIVRSFEHISAIAWAALVIATLSFGPLFFICWSYLWKWGQALLERKR